MLRRIGEIYEEYISTSTPKEGFNIKAVKMTFKVVKHEWLPRYIGDKRGHMAAISEPISTEYI